MTAAAVSCVECGSPVYNEDRFCGACGAPQSGSLGGSGASTERAAKLLAELRALTAGDYEIRGEIGRGGMAVVYLAYDLRLNRKVAIKAMLPDLAFHDGMEERFKREARTAARLDHPNIVVIHSVCDSGDPLFFVMKYVEGAPLDAMIQTHGALPIPLVQGILLQLCPALHYAHSDGVIHRDVKPANILIDTRGNVQVTDFGIAKAADSAHLTRTGLAIGTPTYMCPEQCKGHAQTAASDQYSVGIVAYELLTGSPPFVGSGVATQWAHIQDVPKSLTEACPDCPTTLASAVMRMLAKDPSERWPSLRDAMASIAYGLPPDADLGRPGLAELVKSTATPQPPLTMTPASPVPQQVPRRADSTPASSKPRGSVATVTIEPKQHKLEANTSERLRCHAVDARGNGSRDVPAWSSSNPAVASVDDTGLVTAHTHGSATIAAKVDSVTALATVEVVAATVGRVDVEPSIVSVPEHGSVRLTVRAFTAQSKPLLNAHPTFRSADPSVATISGEGALTGVARGQTTAVVSVGGVDKTIIIKVTGAFAATLTIDPTSPTVNAGEELALTAIVADANGHRMNGDTVTWRSLTPAVAKVNARGRVVARGAGTATIVATLDHLEARTELTVAGATAKRTPIRVFAVVAMTIAAGLAVWTVVRRSDGDGVTAGVTATSGGAVAGNAVVPPAVAASTPAAISVANAPMPADTAIATLELTEPAPVAMEVGETKSLIAHALNKGGDVIPSARIRWAASNPGIASVDADGVVTASAVGQSVLTVRARGRSRTIPVDVKAASAARIALTIAEDSLQVGDTTFVTSQLVDRRDAVVEQQVVWRSANAAVATVDEGGVVRATGIGETSIAATAGSVSDSVTLVVSAANPTVSAAGLDSARLASSSVRAIAQPPRNASRGVAPRAVGALPPGVRAPSEAEVRAVADSVVLMMGRRVIRVAQLTRATGEDGVRFNQFLDKNEPSVRLVGVPVVSDARAGSSRVTFGVVLEWRTLTGRRERTVNLEGVLDAAGGGWAIREIRFPSGFAP